MGKAISKELQARNYKVVILTRCKNKDGVEEQGIRYSYWDVESGIVNSELLLKADYIIHLAGAGVADKRWSAKRKEQIVSSRVKSGILLAETLLKYPNKLKALVCASAIGWYGPDPDIPNPHPFTEAMPHSEDFLGNTCYQWEKSTQQLLNTDIRLVYLRTGIVLSNDGGAFVEFEKPMNFRVATILGTGKQVVSWIHIKDLVQLYIIAMEQSSYKGIYNAVAPNPVSNKELVKKMAVKLGGSFLKIKVPEFLLKTALGEMSIEVLKSTTVSSAKVLTNGFNFQFPNIDFALENLLKQEN